MYCKTHELISNSSVGVIKNKMCIIIITCGTELLLTGPTGHTSNDVFVGMGAVELTIATIATDKLTLMAYTLAKPRKPIMPRTVRLLIHPVVSSTVRYNV